MSVRRKRPVIAALLFSFVPGSGLCYACFVKTSGAIREAGSFLVRCIYPVRAHCGYAGLLIMMTACSGQPLQPWHTEKLKQEFDAGSADEVQTFDDYLELEDRLFEELRTKVYGRVATGREYALVRYSAGSAADPLIQGSDWNRSFELPASEPRGALLLLHGMSDSPYSLKALGEALNERGYWIIALRLPGHGTAPSGLIYATWQDMAAAVRLAMQRLSDRVGDAPIHIAGYSTGAALALNHTLDSLDRANLRTPSSLILISPAVGITPAAALAGTKAAFGRIPGLKSVAFMRIVPEFDPYKYNSFTANAGSQVHKLTRSVATRVEALVDSGNAGQMPPILAFKSTVDATVSTDALVDRLLGHLPENRNELVLFDINRAASLSTLLISDPGPFTNRLIANSSLPFAIRLITNESKQSADVVARYKPPHSADFVSTETLGMKWPRGVISLSHVALPFAPEDELYGAFVPEDPKKLFLGEAEIRGERGLLKISTDWLLRIRYNPFYSVLESRTLEWVEAIN